MVTLIPKKSKNDLQTQFEELMNKIHPIDTGVGLKPSPIWDGNDPNKILGPGEYDQIWMEPIPLENPTIFKVDTDSLPTYSNGFCKVTSSGESNPLITTVTSKYVLEDQAVTDTDAPNYLISRLL